MAAKATVQAGIPGAKEIYMAWGKEKGIAAKALEAAYKEAQPEKTSGGPRGFAEMYYDWLAEASREEQEAHDYIMSNDSQNVRNRLTHYLNIWALAETVRRGEKVVRTISAGKPAQSLTVVPPLTKRKQSQRTRGNITTLTHSQTNVARGRTSNVRQLKRNHVKLAYTATRWPNSTTQI